MATGSLVYLLGIWRTCPLFSGKVFRRNGDGDVLHCLVQRASRWQEQDDGLIALCRLVLLLSVGLLLVGAWYVPADWHESRLHLRHGVCLWRTSATPWAGPASPAMAKRRISAARGA